MRRLLGVVALLATLWPHLAVMQCAVEPAPSHGSHASSLPEHAHDGPECQAIMTCNAAMLEAVSAASIAQPATPPLLHPRLTAVPPARTVPTADPPPPRRIA